MDTSSYICQYLLYTYADINVTSQDQVSQIASQDFECVKVRPSCEGLNVKISTVRRVVLLYSYTWATEALQSQLQDHRTPDS
jgi:hypothetical protein